MNPDQLLSELESKLELVGIREIIEPELVRPARHQNRDRRAITSLEAELQNAIESLKHDERLPAVLFKVANLHLMEGNYARAIMLYEITLGMDSKQIPAWINMGLAYLMVKEYKDAASCFGSALAQESENVVALIHMSVAQRELGDFDSCQKHLDLALKLDPNSARARHGKGMFLKRQGSLEGALTWFSRALEIDEFFVPSLMELGKVHLELGQHGKAVEDLKKVLRADPEQAYAYAILGDIFYELKDYNQCLFYYDRAVAIKFDDPALWIRKGDIHKLLKSYKQAHDAYQKAINADPENVEAWAKSGENLLLMDDQDVALEYFNTALALAPDNADVAHKRGLVYYGMQRYDEALSDFDIAFSVEPNNPEHLYYRAFCLEHLGRDAEAKRTWQVAKLLYDEEGNEIRSAECNARIKRLSQT